MIEELACLILDFRVWSLDGRSLARQGVEPNRNHPAFVFGCGIGNS